MNAIKVNINTVACDNKMSGFHNVLEMSDRMLGIVDKMMNIFNKFSGGSKQSVKSNVAPVEAADPVPVVPSSDAKPKQASSTKYLSKSDPKSSGKGSSSLRDKSS
jgi:hypothetical protein